MEIIERLVVYLIHLVWQVILGQSANVLGQRSKLLSEILSLLSGDLCGLSMYVSQAYDRIDRGGRNSLPATRLLFGSTHRKPLQSHSMSKPGPCPCRIWRRSPCCVLHVISALYGSASCSDLHFQELTAGQREIFLDLLGHFLPFGVVARMRVNQRCVGCDNILRRLQLFVLVNIRLLKQVHQMVHQVRLNLHTKNPSA